MKKGLNKIFRNALFSSAIFVLIVFTSCSQDSKKHEHQSMNMDKQNLDSTIVRVGEIDLQAIDKNKDGMVYQDPMDWNVISDEDGECPICGMKLKEVSLNKAKENLLKHDFKMKEN
jgi:hypothetical protein